MTVWLVHLEISPPFERPGQMGLAVSIQMDDEPLEQTSAKIWAKDFQGMEWMQDPPIHELRTGPCFELPNQIAEGIIDPIRSAKLCVAAAGSFGYIHPTRYRLFIQSGWVSSKLEWVDELPSEWHSLKDAVESLEALGKSLVKTLPPNPSFQRTASGVR